MAHAPPVGSPGVPRPPMPMPSSPVPGSRQVNVPMQFLAALASSKVRSGVFLRQVPEMTASAGPREC